MRLSISAGNVPAELAEVIASITDGAKLRTGRVEYDPQVQAVRLYITRFPLLKRRRILPNLRDCGTPIPAVVTVRKVSECEICDRVPPDAGEEVHLLFGVQVQAGGVSVCSAEEDRGQTCYSITLKISALDIEIADLGELGAETV